MLFKVFTSKVWVLNFTPKVNLIHLVITFYMLNPTSTVIAIHICRPKMFTWMKSFHTMFHHFPRTIYQIIWYAVIICFVLCTWPESYIKKNHVHIIAKQCELVKKSLAIEHLFYSYILLPDIYNSFTQYTKGWNTSNKGKMIYMYMMTKDNENTCIRVLVILRNIVISYDEYSAHKLKYTNCLETTYL